MTTTNTNPHERVFAALATPAFAVDAGGKVSLWNPAMEAVSGISASDILGKKAWTAFSAKKFQTVADLAIHSGEEETEDEFVVTHRSSGAKQTFRLVARPVSDGSDEVDGAVATLLESSGGGGGAKVDEFAADVRHMLDEHTAGDIDAVVPVDKYEGAYRSIAQHVNDIVAGHVSVKRKAMACVAEFAKGNFDAKLEAFPGKKAFINENIDLLRVSCRALIEDANLLSAAAIDGRLKTRADATKHHGDFRKIVEGVNDTLDAVIGPLNVAADYVDRISKGDIPPKITDNYNGDFNEIKNNLNTCIDAVNRLIEDANLLSKAAVEGRLETRADATKHQGDFRKIVEGVNETLDAVIGPLNVAADYVDRISKGDIPPKITDSYNGDFNADQEQPQHLHRRCEQRWSPTRTCSLSPPWRAGWPPAPTPTKHQGDFRKIVEGVNETLDAVIGPLNVAADYVDRISKGDIPPKITDNYNGDFNEIKNNLNTCIDAVNSAGRGRRDAVEGGR